jgi:trehalose 6-phosphate phosphatase
MLHVLAKRNLHVLANFADSNVLLAFDFDGTLAPITRRPDQTRMRRETRRLLTAVSHRYPSVVISGRARDDLIRRVGGVPIWHVAGNHGVEPWAEEARYHVKVGRWAAALERRLAGQPGIDIEDKTFSLTIHYRRARSVPRAKAAIARAIRGLRGVRVIGGKRAISLIPSGAPHKGAALERVRRLLVCDTAVYVGDDDTDEDAFAAAGPQRLLAIRIGRRSTSIARYCLSTQQEIDALLQALLDLRPVRGGPPRTKR